MPASDPDPMIMGRISKQDLHLETTFRLARLIAASQPGSRLPTERELSEKLGVGRSTLREAIRSLAFVGGVRPRQGSGTYVSKPEDQALEKLIGLALTLHRATVLEVVEARRALEIEAVQLAARRHTDSDHQDLQAIMEQMAASSAEPAKASRYDLQYHVMLARASHNSVLVHFINGMRGLLEIWIGRAVTLPRVVEEIVEEHNAVLEAVFARQAARAAEHMDRHLANAADRLFAVVGRNQSTADYISLLLSQAESRPFREAPSSRR